MVDENKKRRIIGQCIICFSIATILSVGIYYIQPLLGTINNYELQEIFTMYEDKAKYIYFLICFLQPIILPLPEPVTIMAGSLAFGPFQGAIIGFSGTILGIGTMFIFSRFASKTIMNKIFDEEKIEKFNMYIQKNETLVILMLFIVPILPDEIICAGAGLMKFNGYKFFSVAIISKLITTFSLSYSLQIIKMDFNSILFIIAIIILIGTMKVIKMKKNRYSNN